VSVSSVSLLEVAASGASLVDIWGRSIGVFGESASSRIGGSASTSSAVGCRQRCSVSHVTRRQQACARCFVGDATDWELERPTLVL
jgi:hypothetical protein